MIRISDTGPTTYSPRSYPSLAASATSSYYPLPVPPCSLPPSCRLLPSALPTSPFRWPSCSWSPQSCGRARLAPAPTGEQAPRASSSRGRGTQAARASSPRAATVEVLAGDCGGAGPVASSPFLASSFAVRDLHCLSPLHPSSCWCFCSLAVRDDMRGPLSPRAPQRLNRQPTPPARHGFIARSPMRKSSCLHVAVVCFDVATMIGDKNDLR